MKRRIRKKLLNEHFENAKRYNLEACPFILTVTNATSSASGGGQRMPRDMKWGEKVGKVYKLRNNKNKDKNNFHPTLNGYISSEADNLVIFMHENIEFCCQLFIWHGFDYKQINLIDGRILFILSNNLYNAIYIFDIFNGTIVLVRAKVKDKINTYLYLPSAQMLIYSSHVGIEILGMKLPMPVLLHHDDQHNHHHHDDQLFLLNNTMFIFCNGKQIGIYDIVSSMLINTISLPFSNFTIIECNNNRLLIEDSNFLGWNIISNSLLLEICAPNNIHIIEKYDIYLQKTPLNFTNGRYLYTQYYLSPETEIWALDMNTGKRNCIVIKPYPSIVEILGEENQLIILSSTNGCDSVFTIENFSRYADGNITCISLDIHKGYIHKGLSHYGLWKYLPTHKLIGHCRQDDHEVLVIVDLSLRSLIIFPVSHKPNVCNYVFTSALAKDNVSKLLDNFIVSRWITNIVTSFIL
jgi:hypothetical protein